LALPESVCKTTSEHVTHKTPELLRYIVQISELCLDEQPQKTALEAMNHEKNLKVSFLVPAPPVIPLYAAKTQGRAPADQLTTPKSRGGLCTLSAALSNALASRLSESGHFLAIIRATRGGTYALSTVPTGELALWRITSPQLPYGRPDLEEGPNVYTPRSS
jgi:hypothetical protein